MSKKPNEVPPEELEHFKRLIDSHPEIELKGGLKLPHAAHNGHMFSQLSKAGIVGLRLGKEEREAFLEKYNTKLFETYGTILKEYVAVPPNLLENTAELAPYLSLSYAYINTLKPKPGKKEQAINKK